MSALPAFIIGIATILIVGLAGRRRDAALQLIEAHRDLTSERANGARWRLFRIRRGDSPEQVYPGAADSKAGEIDDYFVLVYAIESVTTAVATACQRSGSDHVQRCLQLFRGVLPKERAHYLAWHVAAITDTITAWRNWRDSDAHDLKDAGVYKQLVEHCNTLGDYGLLGKANILKDEALEGEARKNE